MFLSSELEAYAGVISALRAQGDLTKEKKDLLAELTKILGYLFSAKSDAPLFLFEEFSLFKYSRSHLSISTERHRAEVRRAVNDERLTTIAYQ